MSYAKNVLQEAYFGPEYIKQVQLQFNKIRAKFRNKPYSTSMAQDSDVLKFNRMMEQLFGFNAFSLAFSPSSDINAYALPIICAQTPEECKRMVSTLKAAKSGFRFDKMGKINGLITLNIGTLNTTVLTDEEVMAIMLHELGHNFFEAVTDSKCIYTLAAAMLNAIKRVNEIISARLRTQMAKDIQPLAAQKDVENACISVKQLIGSFIAKPIGFLNKIAGKITKHETMYDNMRSNRFWYTNEKFADTFAAMYGYGPALHSALMKMYDIGYSQFNLPKNPVITAYIVFDLFLTDILLYILNIKDEHPDGLTRIKVSCDYLKSELAKEGLDPKLKKELTNQLDQMEQLIEDYVSFPKDQDSYRAIRLYYTFLYKAFGGDLREMDTDNGAIFKTIDKRYEELYKK